MPIYLPEEFETEVYGTGSGFVTIEQKQNNETVFVHLSANQFSIIFNHEKRILKEAYESNDTQDGDENSGQG